MLILLPLALLFDLISMSTSIAELLSLGTLITILTPLDFIWAPIAYGLPLVPFLRKGGWLGAMFPILPPITMLLGILSEIIPMGDFIPFATICWFYYVFFKMGPVVFYLKNEVKKHNNLPVFDSLPFATKQQIHNILLSGNEEDAVKPATSPPVPQPATGQ